MSKRITDHQADEILAHLATGASLRATADWAKKALGVAVSHTAIRKLMRRTQTERSEAAKVVVAEKVAGAVTGDLDILGVEIERLQELAELVFKEARQFPTESATLYIATDRALREAIDQRIRYSGATTVAQEPIQGIVDYLGQAFKEDT